MRHPLSDQTAHAIHDCLMLISSRERELAGSTRIRGPSSNPDLPWSSAP